MGKVTFKPGRSPRPPPLSLRDSPAADGDGDDGQGKKHVKTPYPTCIPRDDAGEPAAEALRRLVRSQWAAQRGRKSFDEVWDAVFLGILFRALERWGVGCRREGVCFIRGLFGQKDGFRGVVFGDGEGVSGGGSSGSEEVLWEFFAALEASFGFLSPLPSDSYGLAVELAAVCSGVAGGGNAVGDGMGLGFGGDEAWGHGDGIALRAGACEGLAGSSGVITRRHEFGTRRAWRRALREREALKREGRFWMRLGKGSKRKRGRS